MFSRVEDILTKNPTIPQSRVEDLLVQLMEGLPTDEHIRDLVGSPLKADTVSEMTDDTKIYIYTGSETGYTAGHWYYYNGSSWADGGAYNSAGINTDKTLSVEDKAADGKAVGDELTDLKSAIKVSDSSVVLLDLKPNTYLILNNGEEGSYTGWSATDFIEVDPYMQLVVNSPNDTRLNMFYDANKAFISPSIQIVEGMNFITIPASARYVRFSNTTDEMKSTKVWLFPVEIPHKDYLTPFFADLKPDTYLILNNGEEGTYVGWSATEFIEIDPSMRLVVKSPADTKWNMFYDASKNYIYPIITLSAGLNYIDIPQNAKYVRFSNETKYMIHFEAWMYKPAEQYFDRNKSASVGDRIFSCDYAAFNYFSSGNAWQYRSLIPDEYISVQANTTYVLSVGDNNVITPGTVHNILCVYEYNSSNTILRRNYITDENDGVMVFTTSNGTSKIGIEILGASGETPSHDGTIWVSDVCLYKADTVPNYVPYYYKSHLNSKLSTIKGYDDAIGAHSDRFVFITDTHNYYSNTEHSPSLIKEIQESTYIGFTAFGGDGINAADTEEIMKNRFASFFSSFRDIKNFFPIIGNHEFYSDWLNPGEYKGGITASEVYSYFNKDLERIITDGDGLAGYCIDNPIKKIRYYFIGCNYYAQIPDQTKAWLIQSIQNIPAGYTVIVMTHQATNDAVTDVSTSFSDIHPYLVAMNTAGNSICPLVLCGHTHIDGMFTKDGIHYVATTTDDCALEEDPNLNRSPGTTSEQAFDVVSIDKENAHIYFTRIGAGSDRDFSYSSLLSE